jgi:hypothetical protein
MMEKRAIGSLQRKTESGKPSNDLHRKTQVL